MIKIYCLILSCFLVCGGLSAQIDTSRPPASPPVQVPDTGHITRHDSTIHHLSHLDSVRRDSIHRVRRAIRDSLKLVQSKAAADSIAKAMQAATGASKDSPAGATAKDSPVVAKPAVATHASSGQTILASSVEPARGTGPSALSFWQKVLEMNPMFNFTGKPIVEIFEIHRANSKDSFFYLLVGILFYFALIRIFFEKYFNNLITLFFRVSLRQQQIREQVLQTPLPSLLLNILFVVSAGLYASFLLYYSRIGEGAHFWLLYLYCMLLLGSIYLVKFLVLKFIGWVFSISRATDIYIFVVFLVNKMMGIFLLPFLILITFSGDQARQIFITISFAMVLVLWAYRALAAYRPARNEIKLTPFYFLLYLCAFEIAPLLLIYKVLLTYLEKVY